VERFSAVPLGVLFPVNMGNRGQNMLPVDETFRRLRVASSHVRFVAYHPRISGNFVFENVDRKAIQEAVTIGTRITGLTCLARSFDDLATADRAVPLAAEVIRDSVVLQTLSGVRRIVFVTLSDGIGVHSRFVGILGKRIEALSWSSDRDVLCHYERPGEQGECRSLGW